MQSVGYRHLVGETSRNLWRRGEALLVAHPLRNGFILAFVPRSIVAFLIAFGSNNSLFPDDAKYLELSAEYAQGSTDEWDAYTRELWTKSASFLRPISVVYQVIGRHDIVAQLMTAGAGALTVALVIFLLRGRISPQLLVITAILYAMWPSQIIWSSVFLKDSYVALALVSIAVALHRFAATPTSRCLGQTLAFLVFLLLYLSRIRAHTLACVSIALVIAFIAAPRFRVFCLLAMLMISVITPWVSLSDPAGKSLVTRLSLDLNYQRVAGAVDADTAVVSTAPINATPEALPSEPSGEMEETIDSSTGGGTPNPLLVVSDQASLTSRILENLKYIPSGTKVMLLDPMPWNLTRSQEIRLVFLENIIWYPLLALAFLGITRRGIFSLPLLFSAATLFGLVLMWGQIEGNLGTAFRHRTEFFWACVLLAAIGAERLRTALRSLSSKRFA